MAKDKKHEYLCQLSISQVHLDFWSSQLPVGSCIASNPDFCHRLGSIPSWLGAMRPTSGWIEAIRQVNLKESELDNKVIRPTSNNLGWIEAIRPTSKSPTMQTQYQLAFNFLPNFLQAEQHFTLGIFYL